MDADTAKIARIARSRPEYEDGRVAYIKGIESIDCPHARGGPRGSWLVGWLDARTISRLGHIFRKHDLSLPITEPNE